MRVKVGGSDGSRGFPDDGLHRGDPLLRSVAATLREGVGHGLQHFSCSRSGFNHFGRDADQFLCSPCRSGRVICGRGVSQVRRRRHRLSGGHFHA
jgi:hypothetical protein